MGIKKLIRIMAVSLMTAVCICSSITAEEVEEIEEPQVILETSKIIPKTNPDVVELLKNEIHETRHWDDNCSDHTIQISQADAERLMKIAYAEAGGEGIEGQLRIMMVVWNRVQSEEFPNSVKEVIEMPFQFSSVSNGHYEKAEPTWETHMALSLFEQNNIHDDNVIGFERNDNGAVLLSYFDYYDTIGNHSFYALKKD